MRKRTISKERYMQLKSGDLIVWKGYRLRTIQEGPGDGPHKRGIVFTKLRPSWTGHGSTVYFFNDLSHAIKPANKRIRGLLLKSELLALQDMGFDPRKELQKELKEARRLAKVFKRPLCRGYARLKKLAKLTAA